MRAETEKLVNDLRPLLPKFLHDPDYDAETVLGLILILCIAQQYPHLRQRIVFSLAKGMRERLLREEGL